MTPFDPRAYEDEVIKPLRRRLPHLPDDLVTRYAVDLTMDAHQLQERTEAVVRLWAKIAQRAGQSGLVCTQFLREHDELIRAGSAELTHPGWWRRREQARNRDLAPDIADLAALLAAGHGELGVITDGQLRAAAAAHGQLGDADLELARSAAGLRVVEPIALPTVAGMRGRFDSLTTKLIAAGVDSVPRLLFPQLTAFGLLRGFSVTPQPAGRSATLSATVVGERARELDTLPDSPDVRATREAVGMLATEAAAGTDLTALSLFQLLGPVRDKRADGAGARTLFGLLTRTGLRPDEAGRIAVSVLAESGGRADPIATVTQLLAEGLLVAAQQAAESIIGPPGEAAREAVRRRHEEVERARRDAADDLRAGAHERAGERLRHALRQASDLPGLVAELQRVPAAAVLGVIASTDGGAIRISWRPAPEHAEHADHAGPLTIRVVRAAGRPPADAADGVDISTGPDLATGPGPATVPVEVAVDDEPPIGRPLHYAVFARAGGGPWSRPAVAEPVRIIPTVTDVHVEGGIGVVHGRWRTHPDTVAVDVFRHRPDSVHPDSVRPDSVRPDSVRPDSVRPDSVRPDSVRADGVRPVSVGAGSGGGEVIPVGACRSFRDESAVDGVRYFYSIVASYPPLEPGGELQRSEPVQVSGTTRPEPRPVRMLTAIPTPTPTSDAPAITLGWRQPAGSEIVIRHAPHPCPWPYGRLVPAAELAEYGTVLGGEHSTHGDAVTLVAPLPVGRTHCVAFTLGPDGGIRGQDAVVDLVPPVRRVQARRFGDDVLVSWAWPDAVSAADVAWAGGTRRITLTRYREEGGCLLRGQPAATVIDVRAVLLGPARAADNPARAANNPARAADDPARAADDPARAAGNPDDEGRAPAVSVSVAGRPPRIGYQLRRRGHRLTGGVRATVTLTGTEPVPDATVVIIASAGAVMPGSPAAGVELLRAPIRIEPGVAVRLEAAVPALRRPYWLRCFLAEPAGAVLVDPPVDQLKVP